MFTDKYSEKVDAVFQFLMGFGRGDTVEWDRLQAVMGCHRDDKGGRQMIRRIVKRLRREREIVAFPQTNVGLRLLTDREAAIEVPAMRQRKASRQMTRALRETDVVNSGALNERDAAALAMSRRSIRQERAAINRSRKDVAALLKPTPTNPCRPTN